MNWAIKIISKTLMTKISHISWGVTTKAFTVYWLSTFEYLIRVLSITNSFSFRKPREEDLNFMKPK